MMMSVIMMSMRMMLLMMMMIFVMTMRTQEPSPHYTASSHRKPTSQTFNTIEKTHHSKFLLSHQPPLLHSPLRPGGAASRHRRNVGGC
jgi:hypothetical protein